MYAVKSNVINLKVYKTGWTIGEDCPKIELVTVEGHEWRIHVSFPYSIRFPDTFMDSLVISEYNLKDKLN